MEVLKAPDEWDKTEWHLKYHSKGIPSPNEDGFAFTILLPSRRDVTFKYEDAFTEKLRG